MVRFRSLLPYLVLLILTVVAYLPVWKNGFVDFDDNPYITANPHVLNGLTAADIWWAWSTDDSPYWMPLTWVSLQADASYSVVIMRSRGGAAVGAIPPGEANLSPAVFHGQNLAWHTASVLLLFHLWRRLGGLGWRSFLIAALFAVHPMHVESVAWAIERKDVLSVFFGILTLYAYTRWLEKPGWMRYLAMATAFLLSLLAKPMLITLPFVLLLLDYWPLARWSLPTWAASCNKLIHEKKPLFLLAALFAFITLAARMYRGTLVSLDTISLTDRLANALAGYGWYLSATFWPAPLAALYPHPHGNWSPVQVSVGAACLLVLTALSVWQVRRRPWLIVGWLWFVGVLFPVIGLAQGGTQAWADRFSYWPHIGLFAAVVWESDSWTERNPVASAIAGTVWGLVLGALTALTWTQVTYWRDGVALWEHAIAVTKDNDQAHEHLSRNYRSQGRLGEAEQQLDEAVHIQEKRRPNRRH